MLDKNRVFWSIIAFAILILLFSCSSTVNTLIKVVPNVYNYGNVYVTEKDESDFILLSKSKTDLLIAEISITGRNAAEFTITQPLVLPSMHNPTVLSPQGTLKLQIEFEPQLPESEKIAFLNIKWNNWHLIVNLNGRAIAIPKFAMNPTSHDFDFLSDGVLKTTEITFSNAGAKDLHITDLSFTGSNASDFSVINPATPVTSTNPLVVEKFDGTETIIVQVEGKLPLGVKNANLVITHNAEGSPASFGLTAEVINEATLDAGTEQTVMFDPKLQGALPAEFSYILGYPGVQSNLTIEVKSGSNVIRQLFSGQRTGQSTPFAITWDGKNSQNQFVDPGAYTIHFSAVAGNQVTLDIPVNVIRLGINTISSVSNGGNNEFQMVYYLLNSVVNFTQTPTTGEFNISANSGEKSDLDNDDGSPRAVPAPHTDIKEYPIYNGARAQSNFNLPMCYIRGTTPKFEVKLGASATSAITGNAVTCGYPVSGYQIRMLCKSNGTPAATSTDENLTPNGVATFTMIHTLPNNVSKNSYTYDWSWQYKPSGSATWIDIPGTITTEHTIYTIFDEPWFPTTGTQYAPWVRVVDDVCRWGRDYVTGDVDSLADMYIAVTHGFFLDAGSNGTGDYYYDRYGGGRTMYVSGSSLNLTGFYTQSRGRHINCLDCATISCAIYNMMGCSNVSRIHLSGGMVPLYVIEGIGWGPNYTNNLFYGAHGFGWHAVSSPTTTGDEILDNCLNVDEDGNPGSLPGVRGWNDPRSWASYNSLLSPNNVSKSSIGKHSGIQ